LADRFPPAALNPSAQPWVREVQRRLVEAENALRQQAQRGASANRTLDGIRGSKRADGDIYRRNGVLVPVGSEDFTIFAGFQADQGAQYDESNQFIADGGFASLNVQPTVAALRAFDAFHALYGYARLTGKAFDVSWGTAQTITVSSDLSEVDGFARHWAIQWEFDAPGGTFDGETGYPVTTKLQGSIFDGAIGVVGHQDWTPSPTPGGYPTPGPVVFDSIFIGGTPYEGGGAAVSPASTTVAGIVELATDAEAAAGTDTDRAVTPHALAAALAGAKGLADAWRGDWVAP
jgi:hypothetical protein